MIFIGVGSSIGDAKQIFENAKKFLAEHAVRVTQQSQILKNPPVGGVAKNEFSNAVWEISVSGEMTPEALLEILKNCEEHCGRNLDAERWSDRILDLDLLIWHDTVIDTPDLQVPHPRIAERDFVLLPLAELVDKNFEIPTLGTLNSLLEK